MKYQVTEEMETKVIKPQAGFQTKFLSSSADIVIGGGSAGGGKTMVLLLDPIRNYDVKDFEAVIFRQNSTQIKGGRGLWDKSMEFYPYIGARPIQSKSTWIVPNGMKMKFSHLQYDQDVLNHQGLEYGFIGFDELTHFSKYQFFYMLTRMRSMTGIKPRLRATCNPDPDSWVAKFIEWFIDWETGFPIPERAGKLRYFSIVQNEYVWGNTKEEVLDKAPEIRTQAELAKNNVDDWITSMTFIPGSIFENEILLAKDPTYLAKLSSQDEATRRALLDGNWKHIENANDIFNFKAFNGMFNNKFEVKTGRKYLTADIAGQGSNKFVVGAFDGKELIDILVMEKSNGPEVINGINKMLYKHRIPNYRFIFDNDGIGQLVDGFFEGAIPFNGNSSVAYVIDQMTGNPIKENYFNLKNQLIFRCGKAVNNNEYKISEDVASAMFDSKMTVKERALFERKAFKKGKPDSEQKLRAIPKEQMKAILQNESPDFMDMLCLREWFDLFDDDEETGATTYND